MRGPGPGRRPSRVRVAAGSNVGDRIGNLHEALRLLQVAAEIGRFRDVRRCKDFGTGWCRQKAGCWEAGGELAPSSPLQRILQSLQPFQGF